MRPMRPERTHETQETQKTHETQKSHETHETQETQKTHETQHYKLIIYLPSSCNQQLNDDRNRFDGCSGIGYSDINIFKRSHAR